MTVSGVSLIGATEVAGDQPPLRGVNPATGAELEPSFGGVGKADIERACGLAWNAFDSFRETSLDARARFLEAAVRSPPRRVRLARPPD